MIVLIVNCVKFNLILIWWCDLPTCCQAMIAASFFIECSHYDVLVMITIDDLVEEKWN